MPLPRPQLTSRPQVIKFVFAVIATFVVSFYGGIAGAYHGRILPNVTIDNIEVGGMTLDQARALLETTPIDESDHVLTVYSEDVSIASTAAELEFSRVYEPNLTEAYGIGRTGSIFARLAVVLRQLKLKTAYTSRLVYSPEKLGFMLTELAKEVDRPGTEPSANLKYSNSPNSLIIDPGKKGQKLSLTSTREQILDSLQKHEHNIEAAVAITSSELDDVELESARDRALKFVGKKIVLNNGDNSVVINDQELVATLKLPTGIKEASLNNIITSWETKFFREPQEPEFKYDKETLEVFSFTPPLDGTKLEAQTTKEEIANLMQQIEVGTEEDTLKGNLALERAAPKTNLAETNDLGIKENIGTGTSFYAHSIVNRIHNVAITTDKLSLHIVKPGEQFSFNKTIGEVSAATGYRSAYVIKNGKTELGDGGGVCQVSTTLFRAVLNAGLEITRRLPHSYRVSYYELDNKPGIDATVYSGDVDFRFKNDTDNYVLIYAQADSENLAMKVELYGTSDGRTSEIVDHVTWNPRPALPTQYIPTTELPPGKLQQVDWSAPGISAKFTNIVKDKDGNIKSEVTYTSNYRPWAAKFLQGI
ncbi:MAG: hypothetical protein COU65_04090 [Candidatus Pacebacteria bacterium CG10_big_fil_rev_8_21_14_0_10_42_12]|nr:MAG: hypothetical protein COU65_04090 [Candidatus Pacebacteria bacterium CG10_big_fil_rev_8_21_14_0_10_42_12]